MSVEFCPSCGAPSTGTSFCSSCGKELGSARDRIGTSSEDGHLRGTEAPDRGTGGKRIRRLLRSRSSRMLGGVCGGIGAFLGIDATFVRIAFALFTLASGVGVLVYVALWMIVPSEKTAPGVESGTRAVVVGSVILVAMSLVVAVINLNALPWIWIVVGAGLIVHWKRSRHRDAVPSAQPIDLDAEAEAAWCRNFNVAMARKGDPARIHPGGTICPNCGVATEQGPFCGHCGAKIELSHQNPR